MVEYVGITQILVQPRELIGTLTLPFKQISYFSKAFLDIKKKKISLTLYVVQLYKNTTLRG